MQWYQRAKLMELDEKSLKLQSFRRTDLPLGCGFTIEFKNSEPGS